jgi:hypothetical protein
MPLLSAKNIKSVLAGRAVWFTRISAEVAKFEVTKNHVATFSYGDKIYQQFQAFVANGFLLANALPYSPHTDSEATGKAIVVKLIKQEVALNILLVSKGLPDLHIVEHYIRSQLKLHAPSEKFADLSVQTMAVSAGGGGSAVPTRRGEAIELKRISGIAGMRMDIELLDHFPVPIPVVGSHIYGYEEEDEADEAVEEDDADEAVGEDDADEAVDEGDADEAVVVKGADDGPAIQPRDAAAIQYINHRLAASHGEADPLSMLAAEIKANMPAVKASASTAGLGGGGAAAAAVTTTAAAVTETAMPVARKLSFSGQ